MTKKGRPSSMPQVLNVLNDVERDVPARLVAGRANISKTAAKRCLKDLVIEGKAVRTRTLFNAAFFELKEEHKR